MLALSIRQPFAELILWGIKTAVYRSRSTKIVGQRFWIYASRGGGDWRKRAGLLRAGSVSDRDENPSLTLRACMKRRNRQSKAWSLDLAMASDRDGPPPWIRELANAIDLFPEELPTGVIVGSAIIETVSRRDDGMYAWHLGGVERAKRLRKPSGHPQPVWFRS